MKKRKAPKMGLSKAKKPARRVIMKRKKILGAGMANGSQT